MSVYKNLERHGISLPAVTSPVAAFVSHVQTGNLVFVSGHIAKQNGKPWVGQLGEQLNTEQGKQAARSIAIELIATLAAAVGDLNRISRIVRLMVLVNSTSGFKEQHLVANGASELFVEIFGAVGAHSRCAYGVAQVPFGACVEIDLLAEVKA